MLFYLALSLVAIGGKVQSGLLGFLQYDKSASTDLILAAEDARLAGRILHARLTQSRGPVLVSDRENPVLTT
ncbi:hypothetical protein BN2475_630046 [Paraburkholderia ribeironis]|uniref:Uncharacterized protein n=1 Tax=Paraburkholderia ribeironis TaxID=1247936 RepID=A0A1N7SFR2_9BURK|nr:hypothetical protein BN2475_630046 [Paraburkholderia ribeironis]